MRKISVFSGCFLILALLLTSCMQKQPNEGKKIDSTEQESHFRCEVLSIANGGPFATFLSQSDLAADWGGGMYQSKTAAKEMTVTFEGEEYEGIYHYSYIPAGTGIVNDVYSPGIGTEGNYCYFEVDSLSGELRFIHLASTQLALEEKQAKRITEKEIEEIAKQWAWKWISLDDYESSVEFRDTPNDDWDFYNYRFWSKVNGVETTDYVDLLISNRGRLIFIGASQPGWSREYRKELEEFPVEEAIRQGIEKSGFLTPTINTKRFGITKEGEVVLLLGLTGDMEEGAVLLVIRREL